MALLGCGSTAHPRLAHAPEITASPLGPSFVLIPAPSDDDSLLGRVIARLPQPGQSLEDVAQPNPCASLLEPAKASAMANVFENAEDLSTSAKARAALGSFGFSGDMSRATHFLYKLQTDRRISRVDTAEYQACCKEKGCGVGYVATLVYGRGEYASGEEVTGTASADVAFAAGASGSVGLKVLNKRNVSGWLAAVVKRNDAGADVELGALGPAAKHLAVEDTMPAQIKSLYEDERVRLVNTNSADPNDKRPSYAFADGRGELTENEFVRRFEKVTGSREVADVEGRRNWSDAYLMPIVIGVFAVPTFAFCGGGKAFTTEAFSDRGSTLGSVACGTGVVASYVFLAAGVGVFFSNYDGKPNQHALTQYDAKLLVSRYNRALLRKVVHDVQQGDQPSASRVEIRPFAGPNGVGVWGTF